MGVHLDKPHLWKEDIAVSVDFYNRWFLRFAPKTYREERARAAEDVKAMLKRTDSFRQLTARELRKNPGILFALRMSTAPPLARDRLSGLASVPKHLIGAMERGGEIPTRMPAVVSADGLHRIASMITRLLDKDIFPWLEERRDPSEEESYRAASIVADRLCGANADPIVRNAQERRQLAKIRKWLQHRGYKDVTGRVRLETLNPAQFVFRLNVPGSKDDGGEVNIPVDAVVMPKKAAANELPLMIEAKSAGDFTNTNKRRKEEATKIGQLRRRHGNGVRYILFLCGYFDSGYLGYEAAEGIDWVWEHRADDLAAFGL